MPGRHQKITGLEHVDKVIHVDQSPIGRTPRSNPATYTGVFDHVRKLFASTPEAKMRGYLQGRFSFNVKGGRCEACSGDGTIKIEMNFLPDVYVPCEVCHGARYNRETLEVHYKGKTIAEVLDMPIEEAVDFFAAVPAIARHMKTLVEVGLGYVRLGQPATTLSGGEAQRVKLSSELQKRSTGRTVYVLDEPTTGLHFEDIRKLLLVLGRLVDAGNSVLVIEHNLDVIKTADWLIDMGPEGGSRGGTGRRRGHARARRGVAGELHRPVPRAAAGGPRGQAVRAPTRARRRKAPAGQEDARPARPRPRRRPPRSAVKTRVTLGRLSVMTTTAASATAPARAGRGGGPGARRSAWCHGCSRRATRSPRRRRGRRAVRARAPRRGIQGRVPAADYASGRAARGYQCNARVVGHQGSTGGFKVLRYADRSGHTCAYYDSTQHLPDRHQGAVAVGLRRDRRSTWTDPAHPRGDDHADHPDDAEPARVGAASTSGAACSPPSWATPSAASGSWRSTTSRRTAAIRGSCRATALPILGHESGWSLDGRTFYASSSGGQTFVAVDLADPRAPKRLFTPVRRQLPRHAALRRRPHAVRRQHRQRPQSAARCRATGCGSST